MRIPCRFISIWISARQSRLWRSAAVFRHHLMDIVEPDCAFSVAQYCELAHRCIREVQQRGEMPVLVGGTGLSISSAVVQNIQFCAFAPDLAYRAGLEAEDSAVLYERLRRVDPDSAGRIAPAEPQAFKSARWRFSIQRAGR